MSSLEKMIDDFITENEELVGDGVDMEELKKTMKEYWEGGCTNDVDGVKSSFFDEWEGVVSEKKCELNINVFRKYITTLNWQGLDDEEEEELVGMLGGEKVDELMKSLRVELEEFKDNCLAEKPLPR